MNSNRINEDRMAEVLCRVAGLAAKTTRNAVINIKKAVEESEAEKKAWLAEQERRRFQLSIYQNRRHIQNLIALGLNNMPPHMKFLGTVTSHSVRVTPLDNGIIRATIPCDMSDAPRHFNTFRNTLQGVFDSLHNEAVDTLRDQIRADAYHLQDVFMAGILTAEEEARLLGDYDRLYRSMMERLFKVQVIAVQRQSAGISIDVEVVFNDAGLNPVNYPANIRLAMGF